MIISKKDKALAYRLAAECIGLLASDLTLGDDPTLDVVLIKQELREICRILAVQSVAIRNQGLK